MAESVVFRRVLEELSTFVTRPKAEAILNDCLEEHGMIARKFDGYDVRMILLESLPRRLGVLVDSQSMPAVVRSLEFALVDIHNPKQARRRRASKKSFPRVI
ncbi:MAG: hypothetical protein AAF355_04685 [Myxococcota bacterium]